MVTKLEKIWRALPDRCEVCHGMRGGIRGNENIVSNVTMCDYCCAEKKSLKDIKPITFSYVLREVTLEIVTSALELLCWVFGKETL